MNLMIVGLGLIGGSFAKAVSARTENVVWGFDRDEAVMHQAMEAGAISGPCPDWKKIDLLVAALYPEAAENCLLESFAKLSPGAIAMDLCGIKRQVVQRVQAAAKQAGIHYVGAHPMAGRELSGFSAAQETLFDGASMILTPEPGQEETVLQRIETMCKQIGFGRVVRCDPERHDRVIAYTSQLAHIVSSAYVKSPQALEFAGFSAGSFRDLTRVAKLHPGMWTELFLCNRDNLVCEIDEIITHLQEYRQALWQGDEENLYRLLDEGSNRKKYLEKQEQERGKTDASH